MVRHTSLVLLSVIRFSILNQLSHADFQFGPGELTKAILREARDNVVNNNEYVRSFDWFIEAVQLFNFRTHDNIIIQAYFIDQPSNSESCEVEVKPVIVHCAGYTETSIKYMDYFNQLHRLGYKVFSFDLRGQGFSGFTGDYDNGSTTHMISLNDSYVADLMYFISTYVYPISNNIIFSGNSLGGLIGLTLQAQRQYFQKLILFAPCIRPKIGTWLEYAISFAHYLGFDKYLPTRFDADLSRVLLTHSESKLRGWVTLRKLFPKYLIITGPTFRWLHELLRASWNILRVSSEIKSDILIFQASQDTFVDNNAIDNFIISLGSEYAKLVRLHGTYHELLVETDSVLDHIVSEIELFVNSSRACHVANQGLVQKEFITVRNYAQ